MQKLFVGLAALALMTGGAVADGLSHRGSIKDADQPFSWRGFYVGLHAGGARSDTDWSFFNGVNKTPEAFSQSASSAMFGGQAGLLWQWGNVVAGVEIAYSDLDLSETTKALKTNNRTRTSEINDLFLATIRLGYARDRWLAYAKGGYANAEVDFASNRASDSQLLSTSSDRESGWTIGGGLEYALTQSISLGVEYTFVHLNIDDRNQVASPGFCPAPCTVTDAESDIHSITARLNFKLGGY